MTQLFVFFTSVSSDKMLLSSFADGSGIRVGAVIGGLHLTSQSGESQVQWEAVSENV